jgi:hypothetical protein
MGNAIYGTGNVIYGTGNVIYGTGNVIYGTGNTISPDTHFSKRQYLPQNTWLLSVVP